MPTTRFAQLRTYLLVISGCLGLAGPAQAQDRLPWLRDDQRARSGYDDAAGSGVEREALPPAYGNSAPRAGQPEGGYDSRSDVYRAPAAPGRYAPPLPAYEPPPASTQPYRDDRRHSDREWRDDGSQSRYASSAPYRDDGRRYDEPPTEDGTFSMREIIGAGHGFFGSISQGLASVIEYAFKTQGRPNGYILGEDVGGAFVAGLRYGEGRLYTRDAGTHKVYWQGPSLGYDAGAEGSKVMVLVYRLRDPEDIYMRFGGVAGSAYVVGGVGLTFQQRDNIVLAPIRAGVGFRLGANVGYLKYTRRPTWNPF
ncbi:MAG: EipA family protein [Hyphomicrobiaceae bacterium]|nr:EipA family protein [Hyphomicrobiaceae bacterium]